MRKKDDDFGTSPVLEKGWIVSKEQISISTVVNSNIREKMKTNKGQIKGPLQERKEIMSILVFQNLICIVPFEAHCPFKC